MPNFETFTRRASSGTSTPLITIQQGGHFGVNLAAYELMGSPERVEFLFDRDAQIIGFRACDESVPHSYPVNKQPASISYAISGKAFCNFYGIEVGTARRYVAERTGDILTVDLKQTPIPALPRGGTKRKAKASRRSDAPLAGEGE